VSDEPDDRLVKSVHWQQRYYALGIYQDFHQYTSALDYAKHQVDDDDLEKAVRTTHPNHVWGRLKIGVAILPNGADNQRIFALILRDERLMLDEAPSRQPSPGATVAIAGQIFDSTLASMQIGVLGADGQVTKQDLTAAEDGRFAGKVELPSTPQRYVLSLRRATGGTDDIAYRVPLFAGVPLSPWPIWAPPEMEPPDSPRAYAKGLATAINDYRAAHGLSRLPVSAELSKAARELANIRASAWGPAQKGDPANERIMRDGPPTNVFRAAGFDPSLVYSYWGCIKDEDIPGFRANFPDEAERVARILSPLAQEIGVGVARVSKTDTEDDNVFCGIWSILSRPAPPPSPSEAPADAGSPQPSETPSAATAPQPAAAPSTPVSQAPTTPPASPTAAPASPPATAK
jgi:hypothetical protein